MFETLFPIFVLTFFAVITVLIMFYLPEILARKTKSKRKYSPYECGLIPQTDARERIPIKFYLIAIIFVIFDLEVAFLYPWAIIFKDLGLFGLLEMGLFILILLLGFFYVIGKGVLRWE
jgi:NADH-quinone oxidoreductase subunit A